MYCATFNNISVLSWRSVLLVEESRENHRPAANQWQTLSHNVVLRHWLTDCIVSCKSNYNTITATMAPYLIGWFKKFEIFSVRIYALLCLLWSGAICLYLQELLFVIYESIEIMSIYLYIYCHLKWKNKTNIKSTHIFKVGCWEQNVILCFTFCSGVTCNLFFPLLT